MFYFGKIIFHLEIFYYDILSVQLLRIKLKKTRPLTWQCLQFSAGTKVKLQAVHWEDTGYMMEF